MSEESSISRIIASDDLYELNQLNNFKLLPTALGKATTLSGVSPREATEILPTLLSARRKLILKGGLHPVFLVTPLSCNIEPNWHNYERIFDVLRREHPDCEMVASLLGYKLLSQPALSYIINYLYCIN